jgi:hypothetical protein
MKGRLITRIRIESGKMKHVRNQHRDSGHAAIDKTAGQKKALKTECRRENSGQHEADAEKASTKPFHSGRIAGAAEVVQLTEAGIKRRLIRLVSPIGVR